MRNQQRVAWLRLAGACAAAVGMLSARADAAQVGGLPPRDRPEAAKTGTGAIKGRVIDGQTGTALSRARVRLLGLGQQNSTIITDASGAFAFTDLPAGPFSLMAERSGYTPARYPETGQTLRSSFRLTSLADGQVLSDLTLALFRGGALAGRVFDAEGNPLEYARLRAFRVPRSGQGRPREGGATASTNDLGEFRLAHLEPGRYVVIAIPRQDMGEEIHSAQGQAELSDARPIATFYPGVLSIEQAQSVTVERGRTTGGLDITVIDGAWCVVTGTVIDSSGQPVARGGSIGVRMISKDVIASGYGMSGTALKPDGSFRLRLAPGDYELEAHLQPRGGPRVGIGLPDTFEMGFLRLPVTGDIPGVTITVGAGATASGRLVFDGMTPPPSLPEGPDGRVSWGAFFAPAEGGPGSCRAGRVEVAADGTFTVDGLFGTCIARPMGGFGGWTIKSMTNAGKEMLDQPIRFEPGQQLRDIQVVLTDKHPEITFHVDDEQGQPTRDFVGLMFPVDRSRWENPGFMYVRTLVPRPAPMPGMGARQAGSPVAVAGGITGGLGSGVTGGVVTGIPAGAMGPSGGVTWDDRIGGLTPGEYYAVAVDDIESDAIRDPGTLARLSRAATRVTVTDDTRMELNLRRVKLIGDTTER